MPNLNALVAHCNNDNFNEIAVTIFQYQAKYCRIFKVYLQTIGADANAIKHPKDFVYLPISFFKSHDISSVNEKPAETFLSSGTDGNRSKHLVFDKRVYEKSFVKHFGFAFGDFNDYCHLALLPNYVSQGASSLVHQVDYFVRKSKLQKGAFYLDNIEDLKTRLVEHKKQNIPTILWGVTYALLDFSADFHLDFENLIIIETGGMKGRKKEMIRQDVHQNLKSAFPTSIISSEYGMTELFSQAYWNAKNQEFTTHPSMQIEIRDVNDPFTMLANHRHGAINVIDLNNWQTCSFIETADLGIKTKSGFEVLGRLDNSEIRGCSLMYF